MKGDSVRTISLETILIQWSISALRFQLVIGTVKMNAAHVVR